MFSFVRNGPKTNKNETRQEALNFESGAVNPEEVINLEPSNIPANADGLQERRVAGVDRVQEGYGSVARSGGRFRGAPYQNNKSDSQT